MYKYTSISFSQYFPCYYVVDLNFCRSRGIIITLHFNQLRLATITSIIYYILITFDYYDIIRSPS